MKIIAIITIILLIFAFFPEQSKIVIIVGTIILFVFEWHKIIKDSN